MSDNNFSELKIKIINISKENKKFREIIKNLLEESKVNSEREGLISENINLRKVLNKYDILDDTKETETETEKIISENNFNLLSLPKEGKDNSERRDLISENINLKKVLNKKAEKIISENFDLKNQIMEFKNIIMEKNKEIDNLVNTFKNNFPNE